MVTVETVNPSNTSYSKEEDKIILKEIKKSPDNLKKAFDSAHIKIPHRTAMAISARYYGKLRKSNPVLIVGNSENYTVNEKITPTVLDRRFFNANMRDQLLTTALDSLPKENLIEFFLDNIDAEDKKRILGKILNNLRRI